MVKFLGLNHYWCGLGESLTIMMHISENRNQPGAVIDFKLLAQKELKPKIKSP